MKRNRFLLVVPRFAHPGLPYSFPVGLGHISATLKRLGHEVCCLNLNHTAQPLDEVLKETLARTGCDVLLTGAISPDYALVRDICNAARAARPDVLQVVGGGLVTSDPEVVVEALGADIGVVGEGEETVAELAEALCSGNDLAQVAGLVVRRGGAYLRTASRKPIMDMGGVPWPDFEGLEYGQLLSFMRPSDFMWGTFSDELRLHHIASSRSCPFQCTFCFHPTGKIYRERPLDDFFAELDHVVERYRVNTLCVIDELFAHKAARVEAFCERIRPYKINWAVQLRVETVERPLLTLMRSAGCISVGYGIESLSQPVLNSMQKQITPAQIEKALELTYEEKLDCQGSLIFGDSAETEESARQTLAWWVANRHQGLFLAPLRVFPGSTIYERQVASGRIPDRKAFIEAGSPLLNCTSLPEGRYRKLLDLVALYRDSITYPGWVCAVEATETDPLRGVQFAVEVSCPHCGAHNRYNHIPLGGEYVGRVIWSCRSCRQRLDAIFVPALGKALGTLLAEHESLGEAPPRSALAQLQARMLELGAHEREHPWCLWLAGHLALAEGDAASAANSLAKAVAKDSGQARWLGDLARALHQTGDVQTAEIFARHAKWLAATVHKLGVPGGGGLAWTWASN